MSVLSFLKGDSFMEYKSTPIKKNPSRETCETTIKRILITEVLENGKNQHFRSAADFMGYFEALYPASSALTKQVQRAVKSLNMPKDEFGYFIPNKTSAQLSHETELSELFRTAEVSISSISDCEPLFILAKKELHSYLIHKLETSTLFNGKYETIQETNNGLILYTRNYHQLQMLLESLLRK